MASTDTLDSSATAECPQSDRLKHYLSGWLNESDSEQLELHLQQCDACESALRTLETQQDTLLQSLQATVAQSVSPAAASASASAATARTSEPLASNDARPKSAASSNANASLVPTAATPFATSSNAPELDAAMSKVRRLFDAPAEQESQAFIRSWHPAQRDFGIYELIRPLGRGGMGAVYLAKHRQLGRHVAIKLLPMMSAEDDDVRTRFDREIRVVGRLSHPSIVAATDAGEIDGTQYLVMEYVAGMDLSRLSRLMGRLPVADACELIRQAALGLSCAHAEGVVHRDIKPSNMMLDELGHIRILDFGLAQWTVWDEASVDLTTVGQLMGTLDYMAPEQAEASSGVDYRADLYALGATLFRLLCGRAPLAAAPNQSPLEKLRLLANHQPPKLSTLCPEAPEELVKLVASLLSRSASDRPASAAHVAEQLAPFAEGSKLVELLQQAREKAAASPEPARKSANPDRAVFTESAPASIAPQPEATGKGGSRTLRRLLLAASLPLMILAGILIKLELSKGQLIIESDVDNVNVKLLKEGKPVDGIQVTHGTTSTRLHADTYEITIDGPSDGLIIDHDRFTLKNGETVIARIQQVPRMAKEAGSAADKVPGSINFNNELPGSRESAVVKSDGKPPVVNPKRPAASPVEPRADETQFKTQIQTLLQSKNEAELIKLFEKRLKLPAAPPEPELALTLIEQLPTFPVSMKIGRGSRSEHNYVLDFHAFNCIAKSCPDKFFALWRQSFEAADSESWRLRLIERLQNGMWGNIAETEGRKQDVSGFEAWFTDYIKVSSTPNPEKEKLAPLIASQVLDRFGSFAQDPTLVAAVEASPYIKPDWWLVPVSKNPYQSLADKKRFSAALDVLSDEDCSEADLAKACIIIALTMGEEENGVFFQSDGDPTTLREDLALLKLIDNLLQQQLHRLLVSPDEDLWKTVNLSERFRSPLSVSELQLSSSIEGIYQSLPVAELLDLIFVLREDFTDDSDLEAFFAKCKAGRAKVKLNGRDLRRWLATTEILWDTFRAISIIWTDAPDTRTPQVCSDQLWGPGSNPTKADWIQFCLSYHKALTPYRKEFEAAQGKSQSTPASSVSGDDPELEKRLTQLRQTKDEKEFMAILGALNAVRGDAAVRVAKTILAALPTLPVKERPLRAPLEEFDFAADSRALQLIAEICPTQFFSLWCESYDSALSDEWRLRLIADVHEGAMSTGADRRNDLRAFQEWLVEYSKSPPETSSDKARLLPLLVTRLLWAELDSSFQEPLIKALEESPYIRQDWWLAPIRDRVDRSPIDAKRLALALATLGDLQCSEQQLAASANVVANLRRYSKDLNELELTEVRSMIMRQIQRLLDGPEDALWSRVQLDNRFSWHDLPVSASDEMTLFSSQQPMNATEPLTELLDAFFVTQPELPRQPELASVTERVMLVRNKIRLQGDGLSLWLAKNYINRNTLAAGPLYLPGLNPPRVQPTPQECSDQLWGVGSKPTEADWIQFCLLYHKALAPYRKEFEATQARTKTEPPMPSPAEPLYNGQPLEHWLEMLSRERSVEGLKAAFEACAALLTPQNSETITETLYKVLPGLDGNLQVTDKEQNRVWTLDYEAATILRKANPGSTFFVRWVTARTASTNAEWNKRLLTYISYSGPESFDDLKPVVSWAGSVLSQDVSSNADAVAIADAAVLLRGFLNYESVRDYAELAKTSTDILINCPQLNEDWWISQPIQYRSSNGNKELGTPAFRDKVASFAIRVLEREDSSPSQVAQACMILANGATLNDEQERSVLTVIQRRLEQLAKDNEALVATTTVPESFSDFAAPIIASNSPLPVSQIMITTPSSMTRSIPVTSTSLVVQMLNVVFTIDDGKTTEPQQQLLFEATRGVFDIVMSARPKAQDEQESAVSRGFRIPPNAIPGLLWPDLELTDGAGPFGPRFPQLAQRVTKELWRDHAPTKSDWMHFIILTHPAMKDVVNRAIEDRKNVAPPTEVPKP